MSRLQVSQLRTDTFTDVENANEPDVGADDRGTGQSDQSPPVESTTTDAVISETRVLYLQYTGERRFFVIWILGVQVVAYLVAIGIAIAGIVDLVHGNREGAAWLFLGLFGLAVAVLTCAGISRSFCRPRLWVDLEAQTLNHRSMMMVDVDVLPFAEAEQMTINERFLSPFLLVGPRTDQTGRFTQKGHFGLASGYDDRWRGGGRHHLAELLPTPLAALSDDLMIVDDLEWSDAIRLALFLNVPSLWNAGRTTLAP